MSDIATQLRDALTAQAVRVIDLFREWDEDGDGTVSKKEFRKALPALGLKVPREEADAKIRREKAIEASLVANFYHRTLH